jgi:NAD(P)-dependent dehydrogenase (short-subunit alcohol dehydrogenase family)
MNFDLSNKVAVLTGAGGAISGEIAIAMAQQGAAVALWDINLGRVETKANSIRENGGIAQAIYCDVTNKDSVTKAIEDTIRHFQTIDILLNGAGGSSPKTTTSDEQSFFDLAVEDMNFVSNLNYMSKVIISQGVGKIFAKKGTGNIINITSIAGISPLTRALTYSDSKAAANSFTKWLAVHMAQNYSNKIRVNAIAPGFILTDQNRFLLTDEKTGEMTNRGKKIIDSVPMARYGEASEICGVALWLASDQSSFVTGAIVPVDGGLTAYVGV